MIRRAAALWAAFLLIAVSVWAAEPQFPALTGPVVDAADVLSQQDEARLAERLRSYEIGSGHQLAIATVPSLQGYDVRDFGNRLFRAWALGDKTKNDGVLVLVAPTEHKVSIEVGYGLEGDLTDAMSRIIIENAMVPHFKSNDYAGGLAAGIEDIAKVLGGQSAVVTDRTGNQTSPGLSDLLPLLILLVFVVIILSNASRGRRVIIIPGGYSGGSYSGGGWSSGGGGWSGGGGGGWSGGGGSSGGGGASGSW